MIIKVNIKTILNRLCLFMILLYPFNSTIMNKIYSSNITCILSILVSELVLFTINNDSKRFKKYYYVFFVIATLLFLMLINNYYFKEAREVRVITYCLYLFLPFILYKCKNLIPDFLFVIKLFLIEHLIFTYIAIFFKSFYKENILSFVCSNRSSCSASGNYFHGYIPGLTSHFSTNAIYLSIASLLYFSMYLIDGKKKKSLIMYIISMIALFTTGKRFHIIAIVIISVIMILYNRNKIKKKNVANTFMYIMIIIILALLVFVKLSEYIPELNNIIVRTQNLIDKDDLLNNRGNLISLASKLWENNYLFGNGWGYFSYQYSILYNYYYLDAHNVFFQLLCEVGIVGLSFYLIIIFRVLRNTFSTIDSFPDFDNTKKTMVFFSLGYQLFFILYSFTGNPLYDAQCYVLFFMSIGFILYLKKEREMNLYG